MRNLLHCVLKKYSASLLLSLATLPSVAQDTYWGLDGNKVFNTYTHTVTAIPINGLPTDLAYANPGARSFFDGSGNTLFTTGKAMYCHDGPYYDFQIPGAPAGTPGQVMPIPGQCKQYNVWSLRFSPDHTINLDITKVDISGVTNDINTSALPTVVANANLTHASDGFYGAVAGPLNANGTRYLYFLFLNGLWSEGGLQRFTIGANGAVIADTLLFTALPVNYNSNSRLQSKMKISTDGNTLAYTTAAGKFVTCKLYGTGAGTVTTTYLDVPLSITPVIVGSERRWYYSTGVAVKYYVEGNSNAVAVTTTGRKSALSVGRDGNMYVVQGDPATGTAGNLYYFSLNGPNINPPVTAIPNAKVIGLNPDSTCYVFGNYIDGENINAWNSTPSPAIAINGLNAGTITAYSCNPITLTNLLPGINVPSYQIWITAPGSATTVYDSTARLLGAPDSVDLRNLTTLSPAANNYLSNHSGLYDVIVKYQGPCGITTKTLRINVISAAPVTSLNFTLNGKQSTGTDSVDVWRCGGPASPLILNTTYNGYLSSYTITVTKLPANTSASFNSGNISPKDITAFLTSYDGVIKVVVTINSPCNNSQSQIQFFHVKSSTAAVDFRMNAAYCPPGFQGNPLQHNLPVPNYSFTAQIDLCGLAGWQGALNGGIFNVTPYNIGGVDSSTIRLREVDPNSGIETGPVLYLYKRCGALPSSAPFSAPLSSEVLTEMNPKFFMEPAYATGNRTYKVTVTAFTPSCPVSDSSYFRIAGGVPGSQFWNGKGVKQNQQEAYKVSLYPNPAKGDITFEIYAAPTVPVLLKITDAKGTSILQKEAATDEGGNMLISLAIDRLAKGIYFYHISMSGQTYSGKFAKE